jgi:hypothetical protein
VVTENDDNERNPYAPPVNVAAPPRVAHGVDAPTGGFYRMSPNKLALMSFLTVGLYDLAFFWRHWRAVRNGGAPVSVFWRTVFAPLFCFSLCWRVEEGFKERGLKIPGSLGWAGTLYLVVGVLGTLLDMSSALSESQLLLLTVLLRVASIYPLVSIQKAVNRLLDERGARGPGNAGVTPGAIVMALFGLGLWALLVGQAFAAERGPPNGDTPLNEASQAAYKQRLEGS